VKGGVIDMLHLYDFRCTSCDYVFESLVDEHEAPICPKCADSEHIERAINSFGGYKITGNNSASTKPKGSGSFRK
jgi:putative FmdB family regulatory protein